MTFEELADRMWSMARRKGFGVYGAAPKGWRFDISATAWEAVQDWIRQFGWTREEPITGDILLGYPFRVDKALPSDGLRLVQQR